MTKAELLNLIKGCFVYWNKMDNESGVRFQYYYDKIKSYSELLAYEVMYALPEDPDTGTDFENKDYSFILKYAERRGLTI